jgi:hypothetical protein
MYATAPTSATCERHQRLGNIGYVASRGQGATSTPPCAATTRDPAARVLPQHCRAPRLLVSWPHRLYVSLAVRREYSSPGHNGSTSTSPCIPTTRHPAAQALRQPCRAPRVLVSRPQQLYIDYVVRCRDIVFWPNRRGSITDCHGFVDTRPRIKLSHLFQ